MESFFTCRKIQEVCGVKVRNGMMYVIWWACAEIDCRWYLWEINNLGGKIVAYMLVRKCFSSLQTWVCGLNLAANTAEC